MLQAVAASKRHLAGRAAWVTGNFFGIDMTNEVAALVVCLYRGEACGIIAEDLMIPVESYGSATPDERWDSSKLSWLKIVHHPESL